MRLVSSSDSSTPVGSLIGSNDLGSIFSFMARKYYAESAYPEGLDSVDLWNDKFFYGKIDELGNAVYPSETNLKQVKAGGSSNSPSIFLIDFVADAFSDLQSTVREGTMRGLLPKDSRLNLTKPQGGWYSTTQGYEDWISIMYNSLFTKYFIKETERSTITFQQFLREAIGLFVRSAQDIPVTKTGYILSKLNSPRMSGFVVETQNEPRDGDSKKGEYLDNQAFSYYQDAAKNHGFLVNKNAPWVLVADINSPAMLKYQEEYGLRGSTDVFETYFYKSYNYDIDLLKRTLITFWNSFVQAYPEPTQVCSGRVRARGKLFTAGSPASKTTVKTTRREFVTQRYVDETYPFSFWLRHYFSIRLVELGEHWSGLKFERKMREINQIRRAFGRQAALTFLNKELTKVKQKDTLFTGAHKYDFVRKKKKSETARKIPLSGLGPTIY